MKKNLNYYIYLWFKILFCFCILFFFLSSYNTFCDISKSGIIHFFQIRCSFLFVTEKKMSRIQSSSVRTNISSKFKKIQEKRKRKWLNQTVSPKNFQFHSMIQRFPPDNGNRSSLFRPNFLEARKQRGVCAKGEGRAGEIEGKSMGGRFAFRRLLAYLLECYFAA